MRVAVCILLPLTGRVHVLDDVGIGAEIPWRRRRRERIARRRRRGVPGERRGTRQRRQRQADGIVGIRIRTGAARHDVDSIDDHRLESERARREPDPAHDLDRPVLVRAVVIGAIEGEERRRRHVRGVRDGRVQPERVPPAVLPGIAFISILHGIHGQDTVGGNHPAGQVQLVQAHRIRKDPKREAVQRQILAIRVGQLDRDDRGGTRVGTAQEWHDGAGPHHALAGIRIEARYLPRFLGVADEDLRQERLTLHAEKVHRAVVRRGHGLVHEDVGVRVPVRVDVGGESGGELAGLHRVAGDVRLVGVHERALERVAQSIQVIAPRDLAVVVQVIVDDRAVELDDTVAVHVTARAGVARAAPGRKGAVAKQHGAAQVELQAGG